MFHAILAEQQKRLSENSDSFDEEVLLDTSGASARRHSCPETTVEMYPASGKSR